MIGAALLLLASAEVAELRWHGRAVVHAGDRTIPIELSSSLFSDGRVVSESWPVTEGRTKGLRRMIIDEYGSGRLERGDRQEPMAPAMLREEGAQFGFYLQLQDAARWCSALPKQGSTVRVFSGAVETAFRCSNGQITRAANWVASDGAPVRQDFRITGLWHSSGWVFPKRMSIRRNGKAYFEMAVTRFTAR